MVERLSSSSDLSRMISAFEGFVFESFVSSVLGKLLMNSSGVETVGGGGGGHVLLKGLTRLPIY